MNGVNRCVQVKNGTPPQRKSALRQLTDKARDLGAGPLFNQILPLLMSPTLEDQERHLLVKVLSECTSVANSTIPTCETDAKHVCPTSCLSKFYFI